MDSAMSTGLAGGQARSLGRTATAIRDLDPGSFAFVMATGIISSSAFQLGPEWLFRAPLAAAAAGLVVRGAALAIRLARFRSSVVADVKAPERVFGFYTIVAAIDVLGVRLAAAGHPLVTAILAGLAAAGNAVPVGRGVGPGHVLAVAGRAAGSGRRRAVGRGDGAAPVVVPSAAARARRAIIAQERR
jgi:hypothetical protein